MLPSVVLDHSQRSLYLFWKQLSNAASLLIYLRPFIMYNGIKNINICIVRGLKRKLIFATAIAKKCCIRAYNNPSSSRNTVPAVHICEIQSSQQTFRSNLSCFFFPRNFILFDFFLQISYIHIHVDKYWLPLPLHMPPPFALQPLCYYLLW